MTSQELDFCGGLFAVVFLLIIVGVVLIGVGLAQ